MKFIFKPARLALWLGVVALAACGQSGNSVVADWHTNGRDAKQIALQTHRLLFIAFMGSDWSEPCQTIRKDVLDTKVFKDFADANLVLVMADFPRGTALTPDQAKQEEEIAKGGQVDRVPVFMLVDPRSGQAFGRIANFFGGPEAFIGQIQTSLDQYAVILQSNAQAASVAGSTPSPAGLQPSPTGSAFSQPVPAVPAAMPALPAFPSSLPSPEELVRRQQQAPPTPQ